MINKGHLRPRMISAMREAGHLALTETITPDEWSGWIQYWCERTNQPEEVRLAKQLSFEKALELATWYGYPQIVRSD